MPDPVLGEVEEVVADISCLMGLAQKGQYEGLVVTEPCHTLTS